MGYGAGVIWQPISTFADLDGGNYALTTDNWFVFGGAKTRNGLLLSSAHRILAIRFYVKFGDVFLIGKSFGCESKHPRSRLASTTLNILEIKQI